MLTEYEREIWLLRNRVEQLEEEVEELEEEVEDQ